MRRRYNKDRENIQKKIKKQLRYERDREIRIKAEIILLALKLGNAREACLRRGFSISFYDKWWSRLKASNFDLMSLYEHSRKPKGVAANKIKSSLERRIKQLGKKGYGAPMIRAILAREGKSVAQSTVSHVLSKRRKSTAPKKNKLKAHRRRYELDVPGERVQIDVKYVPEFVAGKRVYVYVAVDEATRLRYSRCYDRLQESNTYNFLDRMAEYFKFPIQSVQTDNGFEFTYRLMPQVSLKQRSEHMMAIWCSERGIRHRCIPPGEKELNGKVERSHRIDEQYFYWRAPTDSVENFNKALEAWLRDYNQRRLHGGLSFMTPQEKYQERKEFLLERSNWPKGKEGICSSFIDYLARTRRLPKKRLSEDEQIEELIRTFNSYRLAA